MEVTPLMTVEEMAQGDEAWTYASRIIGLSLRNSLAGMSEDLQKRAPVFNNYLKQNCRLPKSNIVCKTARAITLQPGTTRKIKARAPIHHLSKRVNFLSEQLDQPPTSYKVHPGYTYSKAGSNKMDLYVQNLTKDKLIIPKGTEIGKITPANEVPPWMHPEELGIEEIPPEVISPPTASSLQTTGEGTPNVTVMSKRAETTEPEQVPEKLTGEQRRKVILEKVNLDTLKDQDPKILERVQALLQE
jgi:hypothetical protein